MSGTAANPVPGAPGVPGPGRGMPTTPRTATAASSPIPQVTIGSGMIAPANAFVLPDGTLTGISFRFLFEVWQAVNTLQADINTINTRLANAGIP